MKKNNPLASRDLAKPDKNQKKILLKPLAKGVILKSAKNENGLWLYGFAARMVKGFRQTALPYDDTVKRYEPRKRKPNNDNFGFGAWNFRTWHKIFVAFASIAVIGIVVFFQFAPEKASAWSSVAAVNV